MSEGQVVTASNQGGTYKAQSIIPSHFLPQPQQIITAQTSGSPAGGVAYNVIPAQQVQTFTVDGHEAIFIPAQAAGNNNQAIQIASAGKSCFIS